jgi:hypothetical protein
MGNTCFHKLRTYSRFKHEFQTEMCMTINITHRSAYAKFRCGLAPLCIETGRYERLQIKERELCHCVNEVESEEHVRLFVSLSKCIQFKRILDQRGLMLRVLLLY